MPTGGRIINISSIASKMGIPLLPVYGATKAALDSLTYTWASEVECHSTSLRVIIELTYALGSLERVVA
jgi:NAD(P)-dependent dehydrogenase (short-subunit alcohol dehydrogenase family)